MRVRHLITAVSFPLLVAACTGGQASPTAPPLAGVSGETTQGATTTTSPGTPTDGAPVERGGNTFGSGN